MHCVIPAAGRGTRMRPHTWSVPKPLLPVAGKPILGHLIDSLEEAGVDRITLVTGYLGDMLVDWTKRAYPRLRVDFVEQKSPDGLGSAVGLAADLMDSGPVMVALADTLFLSDLSRLKNAPATNMLAVCPVDDPERFGIVITGDGGEVVRLVEKPREPVGNLAIVGVYYFRSGDALIRACASLKSENLRTRGEFQLTDAMQLMLNTGEPFTTWCVDRWFDCGTTETLVSTNRALLDRTGTTGKPVLEDSAVIGPCSFGSGVVLRRSVIGPHVSVGKGSLLEDCLVSDSVIGEDTRVGGTRLSRSVIGSRCTVRGSAKTLSTGDDGTVEL